MDSHGRQVLALGEPVAAPRSVRLVQCSNERRPPRFFPVTEFIASAFIMALSPSARTRLKSCGAAPPTAPLVSPHKMFLLF